MKIQVELTESEYEFTLGFAGENSFNISFSEAFTPTGVIPYAGEYEAIPKVTEQSLPTKDRYLSRDVLIKPIPYYEVENTERGTTAIIGGI